VWRSMGGEKLTFAAAGGEALGAGIDIAGHLHFTSLEKRAQETEFGAGGEETELCECLNIYEMESCTVLHIFTHQHVKSNYFSR
jgi:hypothetical protein